jgi:hypothetical protein
MYLLLFQCVCCCVAETGLELLSDVFHLNLWQVNGEPGDWCTTNYYNAEPLSSIKSDWKTVYLFVRTTKKKVKNQYIRQFYHCDALVPLHYYTWGGMNHFNCNIAPSALIPMHSHPDCTVFILVNSLTIVVLLSFHLHMFVCVLSSYCSRLSSVLLTSFIPIPQFNPMPIVVALGPATL